ncbi:RNA polymerase sigma factor [Treponema saccharophilum]|jgi:RNA polymerase sigma-70 factor (ECF subfamily)|uniref:RNA polymerase sigma factor n=1 Tax=Treponema saccharophilum TaxID=165 RepID=UPI00386D670F
MKNGLKTLEQTVATARDWLLIKAALGGDSKSFSILVSFHKKRVQAIGFSFFKNDADVEDFVQEVLLKAFNKLGTFKGGSLFSTWLTRIALNTAINAKNRRQEYKPLADEDRIAAPTKSPEETEIRKATAAAIREAVRELPEKYAVCIELYFFYDNSYEEIAEITSLNMNTVKSNIFRAKKILKEKLRQFYEK